MGFDFLQLLRPQGNRGVSGNCAGSAEVCAARDGGVWACVQGNGQQLPWKFQREPGENRPRKSPHVKAPAPGALPGRMFIRGVGIEHVGIWGCT